MPTKEKLVQKIRGYVFRIIDLNKRIGLNNKNLTYFLRNDIVKKILKSKNLEI